MKSFLPSLVGQIDGGFRCYTGRWRLDGEMRMGERAGPAPFRWLSVSINQDDEKQKRSTKQAASMLQAP